MLAADGAFDPDGGFRVLRPIPRKVLEPWFRREVLAWRHTGFSAHNNVRVRASDAPGRRRLAQYMQRAPVFLEKMSNEPVS